MLCIRPQSLDAIKISCLFHKDVYNHICKVNKYPHCRVKTFHMNRLFPALFHLIDNLIGNRFHLRT